MMAHPLVKIKKLSECELKVTEIPSRAAKKQKDPLQQTIKESLARFDAISDWYAEALCVALFVVLQSVVSSGNYSGFHNPPIFGDFEAQRHWMEITVSLPLKEWYVNSTKNDLNYWGLDYPPLTAYHSWILGKISEQLDPSWVALEASRGLEIPTHKLFMRLSVMLSMTLLYAPVIIAFVRKSSKKSTDKGYILVAALCYPGLIFVDNGHFQYNHIALGLFLWAVYCFEASKFLVGSVLFVLALNFKQMELYHALPIFIFLLSRSLSKKGTFFMRIWTSCLSLCKIATIVLFSFLLVWVPFLFVFGSGRLTLDIELAEKALRRLFPFNRGVFEDKVANFWCCISVIVKVKLLYTNEFLAALSASLVLLTLLPSLLILLKYPAERNFRLCLVISSLSFYLFSFQVHEKSILMAVVPALLLFNEMPKTVPWFLSISLFSIYPLCIKDVMPEILPLFVTYHFFLLSDVFKSYHDSQNMVVRIAKPINFVVAILICFLMLFVEPPEKYPHLFDLLNAVFSFAHFSAFWLYANFLLVQWNYFTFTGKSKAA